MRSDFKIPNRKKIGGALLNKLRQLLQTDKVASLKEALTFGLTFLEDDAIIKRTPLINDLAMCGDSPPVVVAIDDCTKHMADGRKKDATHIADLFGEKAEEYDPDKMLTDLFFFRWSQ